MVSVKKIASAKSEKLSTFGFIASIIVVMSHADLFVTGCGVAWVGNYFVAGHVYNFFLLSGFLIAKHLDDVGWYGNELRKRLKTLCIPYFIWGFLYWAFKAVSMQKSDFSIDQVFGISFGLPPYNVSLWYLKCLLAFILVLPLFSWATRRFRTVAGVSTLLLILHAAVLAYWPELRVKLHYGFNIDGFCLFLAGASLRRNIHRVRNIADKVCTPWWSALAMGVWIGVSLLMYVCQKSLHPFLWHGFILVCVASLVVVCRGLHLAFPRTITSTSFFVVAFHLIVLRTIAYAETGWLDGLLGYAAVVIVTVGVSVVTALTFRKVMPKFYSLLMGGR